MTGLWFRQLFLMSPKHPAYPKIYSQTFFHRVTGYQIPILGFATRILTAPAGPTDVDNGTMILLFHWGNFQTDIRLPKRNVANQGAGRTSAQQLFGAKRCEMRYFGK